MTAESLSIETELDCRLILRGSGVDLGVESSRCDLPEPVTTTSIVTAGRREWWASYRRCCGEGPFADRPRRFVGFAPVAARIVIKVDDEPGFGDPLDRLRAFCAMLPEATEVEVFGNPTFRVGARGFATFEQPAGRPVVTVKIAPQMQRLLVDRDGFDAEADTGHFGWTHVSIDGSIDWDEVDELVIGSYRLVAPPEYVTQLDELLASGG